MELQTTFYIVGLVFMGIMLILIFAILAAVLVIKAKINHVHQLIDEKVNAVKDVFDKAATAVRTVQHFVKK